MVDGEALDPAGRHVSVLDRGFLFGDGVFEVARTYGGRRVFALDEHLARLAWSAERVGIALPVEPAVLAREVEQALVAGANPESYVRVVVTRGVGPIALDPDGAERPTRVVIVQALRSLPEAVYRDGVELALLPETRPLVGGPAAGAKTCNYVPNLLAVREAHRRGAHEAVFVTSDGFVTEGASSNVFALRGGVLATCPLSAGILAGITRRHVIALAGQQGLAVVEAPLTLEALQEAEEVFISSSIREIVPVVRLDGRPIGTGLPGARTQALHAAFVAHARASTS